MSDASRLHEASARRLLRPEERALLTCLLGVERASDLSDLTVSNMSDGGMGSIRFAPFASARQYASTLAEAQFTDADGVLVSVALSLDQQGRLFELDIWKVDFSPLVQYPKVGEVTFQPRSPEGSIAVRLPHSA